MQHVEDTLGARQLARDTLVETAVRYAEDRHWDVVPGASVIENSAGRRCGCGHPGCATPGAHPILRDWAVQAASSPALVRRWWGEHPDAAILLPTGRGFDVIDVPEQAGCLALARLERMGLPLGPVIATPTRRLQFLVLPGARDKMGEMLRRIGWGTSAIDLIPKGDGDWVVAPPSRMGSSGSASWAREPTELNRWLPEARELVSPIAYACGRALVEAR
ncbi:bifunctional DNA primase/polymerase [Embleya sp. NBC_00888]|uniref:bifunctional DNA primase/polymerase n=1 Tax=Embleya sp. NBC_00888 TaxID=2975960 RepID=UPI0038692EB2|nr:bifunctional DNA primase/polymerase [Embleya sp. NBC_00888]